MGYDFSRFEEVNARWIPEKPVHKTGDEVFYVKIREGKSQIGKSEVRSVPCDVMVIEEQLCLKFNYTYEINTIWSIENEYYNPFTCPSIYLFSNEEEANIAGKFWPVGPKQWLAMIGCRNIEEGKKGNIHDGCELQSCCAEISSIRDDLEKVQKYKGIMEVDRLILKEKIESHGIPEDAPKLRKLFKELDLI